MIERLIPVLATKGLKVAAAAPGRQRGPLAVLVVACDMCGLSGGGPGPAPGIPPAGGPACLGAAELATGRLEVLAAVYEPVAIGKIEGALDRGGLSVTDLPESIGAHGSMPLRSRPANWSTSIPRWSFGK